MDIVEKHRSEKVFLIPSKRVIKIINQKDILYVRAESNYSVFVLDDKTEWLISKTLENVEKSLEQSCFFRCHKSYLVNLSKIREITRRRFEVVMSDNIRLPIARRKRKEFMTVLQN